MTSTPVIFADFQNADPAGRVRLNTIGTIGDLFRFGVVLRDGLPVVIHDDEFEADGVVRYSSDEHVWVAAIDWDQLRPDSHAA